MPDLKRPKFTISFDPDDFYSRDTIISLLQAARRIGGCGEFVIALRSLLSHSQYLTVATLTSDIENLLTEFADDISEDI